MLSVDRDAMVAARRRHEIGLSDFNRQSAVADFVLRYANMAGDLRKMLRLLPMAATDGVSASELREAIEIVERRIRQGFVETFGHDMISQSP